MENSKSKYLPVVKPSRIRMYQNGVVSQREFKGVVNVCGLNRGRCGAKIKHFSYASRRRLRETLISRDVEGASPFAVTLTLPSSRFLLPSDLLLSKFPDTVNRFGNFFKREFHKSAIIYRAELQLRGVPHLHCLLWLHPSDWALPDGLDLGETNHQTSRSKSVNACYPLSMWLAGLWFRAVYQTVFTGTVENGRWWLEDCLDAGKGIAVDALRSAPRLMRYCSDHLSKHKREQLGYPGRQWGVIGGRRMRDVPSTVVEDRRVAILFARVLGKIRRSRLDSASSPFGWRHSPYHPADAGVSFASSETLTRLLSWATHSLQLSAQTPQEIERRKPAWQSGEDGFENVSIEEPIKFASELFEDLPRIARGRRGAGWPMPRMAADTRAACAHLD